MSQPPPPAGGPPPGSKRKRKPSALAIAAQENALRAAEVEAFIPEEIEPKLPTCLSCSQPIANTQEFVTCTKCNGHCHVAEAEITQSPWRCPNCVESCIHCRKPGSLMYCSQCAACYHAACTYPRLRGDPQEWRCGNCLVLELPTKVEKILDWRFQSLYWDPSQWGQGQGQKTEQADESAVDATPAAAASGADADADEDQPEQKDPIIRWMHVKWKDRSFIHCSWVEEFHLATHHPVLLRHFLKRNELPDRFADEANPEEGVAEEEFEEEMETGWHWGIKDTWVQTHRIIAHKTFRGVDQYLVKWKDLAYDHCTWEFFEDIENAEESIVAFERREKHAPEQNTSKKDLSKIRKYTEQPSFVTRHGGSLHPYQLEGLNWLRISFSNGTNTILADEMGLGKTVQTIAFVTSLYEERIRQGPFLISVPLSTLANWEREFSVWAPQMNVIIYSGNANSRQIIRQHEFYATDLKKQGGKARPKFNVLLTSFETVLADSSFLGSIHWQLVVVDEAQRLKNKNSKFFREMCRFKSDHRLLLTGTPLQNNLEELFHLLNFIEPDRFGSLQVFQDHVSDVSKDEQVARLHQLLGPHLLRRLKADVLLDLPSKSEFIVCVGLSSVQKSLYKLILEKNFEALNKGLSKKSGQVSLLNVMMELKKCCNHPYLFPSYREEADTADRPLGTCDQDGSAAWHLVQSSGKLLLLDKMLLKLKATGHRVLIFSQMTKLLDVLEEYIQLRGFLYERIDGNVTGSDRQERIDRFNAPEAKQFIFLLSTRAGGLGINLASADTVVIYDSDWNPHNDIQAFSRAHRLGQSNKVMVYRFVTRNTIEERIVELAKKKMMLTHLVVRSGSSKQSLSQRELDDILKFGTAELFSEETSESDNIVYSDQAIDNLLDRSNEGLENKETIANEYLSSFKVATFTTEAAPPEEEEEEEPVAVDGEDDHWSKLLADRVQQSQLLEEATMGKGKRVRKTVDYTSSGYGVNLEGSSDEEMPDEQDTKDADYREESPLQQRKRSRKSSDRPPMLSTRGGQSQVFGFSGRQRAAFLKCMMSVGLGPCWFERLYSSVRLQKKSMSHMREYANLFLGHLCEPSSPAEYFSTGVPKEGFPREALLERIGIIHLVHRKVSEYYETPAGLTPNQLVTEQQLMQGCQWANPEPHCGDQFHIAEGNFTTLPGLWATAHAGEWGRHQDLCLLIGILKHGYAAWTAIVDDESLQLQPYIPHIGAEGKDDEDPVPMELEPEADSDQEGKPEGTDGDKPRSSEVNRAFVIRRFKLLETALITEDQILGGTEAGLEMNPNDEALALYNAVEEVIARTAVLPHAANRAVKGDAQASAALVKALRRLDSVMREAKDQLVLLPQAMHSRLSVCQVFQLSEYRIMSRLPHPSMYLDPRAGGYA